jgi:signal transduction histidine kinase
VFKTCKISKEMNKVLSYKKLQQLDGDGVEHSGEFRILVVDDNLYDSELVLRELNRQDQVKFTSKVVMNKADYEKALVEFSPDVVYCDFKITPDFTAITAIRILKEDHPDVPFVLVTGTLSDEVASICVYEGIDDYVLKSNLERIRLSLFNAIKCRKIELQKKEVYEKLVSSEAQVRNFARHTNKVLEEERAHLAREIHDELGQQLTGIKISLSAFKKFPGMDRSKEGEIERLMREVDLTIQSLRKIATELRPGILDTMGLVPSIQWLSNEFEKKTGIRCKLAMEMKDHKFDKDISICVFRICQEALTNIAKHAQAGNVYIQARQKNKKLMFTISDDGKGMSLEKLANPFSMGLLGMRERANMIGAVLDLISVKGSGTSVQLSIN